MLELTPFSAAQSAASEQAPLQDQMEPSMQASFKQTADATLQSALAATQSLGLPSIQIADGTSTGGMPQYSPHLTLGDAWDNVSSTATSAGSSFVHFFTDIPNWPSEFYHFMQHPLDNLEKSGNAMQNQARQAILDARKGNFATEGQLRGQFMGTSAAGTVFGVGTGTIISKGVQTYKQVQYARMLAAQEASDINAARIQNNFDADGGYVVRRTPDEDALKSIVVNGTKAQRILMGTNGKIAIIGRSMHGPGGVVDYTQGLNELGYDTHLFAGDEISAASRAEWDSLKELYGDEDGLIPQNRLIGTIGFNENKAWAQTVKDAGYTVIDIGNPNNKGFSVYYSAEKRTFFGQSNGKQ